MVIKAVQDSVFGDLIEMPSSVPVRKKIIRRPMPEKQVVKSVPLPTKIPFEEEVLQLLAATKQRAFLPEYIQREKKDLSEALIRASENFQMKIEEIVTKSIKILQVRPYTYPTQAINLVTGNSLFSKRININEGEKYEDHRKAK